MAHSWIFLIFFVSTHIYICGKITYKNYKILEIEGEKRDIKTLIQYLQALDPSAAYQHTLTKAHVLLPPALVERFMNFANTMPVNIRVKIKDYAKLLEIETKDISRNLGSYSWTKYHDIDDTLVKEMIQYDFIMLSSYWIPQLNKFLKVMQENYSNYASLIIGGDSYEGRKILGVRIATSNFMRGAKRKPVVFIEAGIHGREWMSPASVTYFINQLLTNNSLEVTSLRDNFDWHIFPVTNPDGYHHSMTVKKMWRKSRNVNLGSICKGVDLNRNWDYNFGTADSGKEPCFEIYHGTKAFSEVETRSLASYITNIDNLMAFFAIHTPINSFLIPHSDTGILVDNYTLLEKIAQAGNKYSGQNYDIGNAPMLIGRKSGTSMDWVYRTKQPSIALTIELKGGVFFAPSHNVPQLGDELTKMFIGIFSEAHKQGLY